MQRGAAAAGSALFFALAPGTMAGVVPWLLTRWSGEPWWPPLGWAGVALVLVSGALLVRAFVRFAVDGLGTPAPVAPTEQLVVSGPYRHVLPGHHRDVRPSVRGADAAPAVPGPVPGLPGCGAGVAAAPAPVATAWVRMER